MYTRWGMELSTEIRTSARNELNEHSKVNNHRKGLRKDGKVPVLVNH